MRVVHVITGLTDGGAEAVLYRLCLASSPVEHVVVSLTGPGLYGPKLKAAGIIVHNLDMPRGRLTAAGLLSLLKLLRQYRPDVVQTWMYHADLVGGVVAHLQGHRRVIWNIRHSDLAPRATGRTTRLVAKACAILSRFIPWKIVVCAERAETVHAAIGYDATKFVLIANGFDVSRFRPNPEAGLRVRQSLGISPQAEVLILVARWNAQKDHSNLLAAVERLRRANLHVLLVGSGCEMTNPGMAELVSSFAGVARVHTLGRQEDIPALLCAADLHVLSSSHGEAFPNVVAEAMACGIPCIATDVGDAATIVGSTGWIVPPRDAEALSKAIEAALEARQNEREWRHRQESARSRIISEFSLDKMVAKYHAIWAEERTYE